MRTKWFVYCLTVVLCIAFSTALTAKDAKGQGFSGKWTLDKKSSHGSQELDDLHQVIKSSGSELVIQSQFPEPKSAIAPLLYLGIMTSSFRVTTDGQQVTNQVGPYMVSSRTTVDGNKMTTDWQSTINGDPVQGKWVHTLSDGGKTLTVEITESSTHDQKGNATLVMKRK